jgi:hypothetical protein
MNDIKTALTNAKRKLKIAKDNVDRIMKGEINGN